MNHDVWPRKQKPVVGPGEIERARERQRECALARAGARERESVRERAIENDRGRNGIGGRKNRLSRKVEQV